MTVRVPGYVCAWQLAHQPSVSFGSLDSIWLSGISERFGLTKAMSTGFGGVACSCCEALFRFCFSRCSFWLLSRQASRIAALERFRGFFLLLISSFGWRI